MASQADRKYRRRDPSVDDRKRKRAARREGEKCCIWLVSYFSRSRGLCQECIHEQYSVFGVYFGAATHAKSH